MLSDQGLRAWLRGTSPSGPSAKYPSSMARVCPDGAGVPPDAAGGLLHGDDGLGLLAGVSEGPPVHLDRHLVDDPVEGERRVDVVGDRQSVAVAARHAGTRQGEPPGREPVITPSATSWPSASSRACPRCSPVLVKSKTEDVWARLECRCTLEMMGLQGGAVVDVVQAAVVDVEAPAAQPRALSKEDALRRRTVDHDVGLDAVAPVLHVPATSSGTAAAPG